MIRIGGEFGIVYQRVAYEASWMFAGQDNVRPRRN